MLIQEKWLDFSKSSELCGILISCIPSSSSRFCSSLENKHHTIMLKTSSLAATRGSRTGLELLQSPIPRECHYLTCLVVGSLEDPTYKAVFIWLHPEVAQHEEPFPRGVFKSSQRQNHWLLQVLDNFGQTITKSLNKSPGNTMPTEGFEKLLLGI